MYQEQKANFLFHDSSWYMTEQSDEGYGCTGAGCIPESKFYQNTGEITDKEITETYKKLSESQAKKRHSETTFRMRTIRDGKMIESS